MTQRVSWLWAALMAATALSWAFGHGLGAGADLRWSGTAVLLIAFLKARVVFLDFMELRHAPAALRLAFECWTLTVAGTLVALYW
ncbi:MAG: hypothetical protein EXR83_10425 [Gammaproteobacteria bacterium]|nr:hypothetical protein [Gammaproteobacteria bacterium]